MPCFVRFDDATGSEALDLSTPSSCIFTFHPYRYRLSESGFPAASTFPLAALLPHFASCTSPQFCRCLSPLRSPRLSSHASSVRSLLARQPFPSPRNPNRARCPTLPRRRPSQLAASGASSTCSASSSAAAKACSMQRSATVVARPRRLHTDLCVVAVRAVSLRASPRYLESHALSEPIVCVLTFSALLCRRRSSPDQL